MFCQIFEAEMKSEIFTETQIRQALQYHELGTKMTLAEKFLTVLSVGGVGLAAWQCE
jgi:hypothetical protein